MYRRYRKPEPRNMVAKYAGQCACCGVAIKAGEWITYYPANGERKAAVYHMQNREGDSGRCYIELVKQREAKEAAYPYTPDCYPDPGELAEDRWNETHR